MVSEKEVREHFCKKVRRCCVQKRLKLRYGLSHGFDCVSVNQSTYRFDGNVVGEISSATLSSDPSRKNINGYENTKKLRILEDLFFLSLVKAKRKYLILTDRNIYEKFNSRFGKFAKQKRIKILCMS